MTKIKTKRERIKFESDNVTGACPEVLDDILKANDGYRTRYGNEKLSKDLYSNNVIHNGFFFLPKKSHFLNNI